MPENATRMLIKSEKGAAELAATRPSLDFKSRQLLILADGVRSLGQIQALRPSLDIYGLADALVAAGFLQAPSGAPSVAIAAPASPTPSRRAPEAPLPMDPDRLAQAQTLMIAAARQHLGLLGGEIIAEIARSSSEAQMRNCVAQWHMALRQSRHGKESAQQLLDSVHQLLES